MSFSTVQMLEDKDTEDSADWGGMLDRLSHCITPQEEAAIRQAAVDRGSPSHLRNLHNLVAGLLVGHGITTWDHLHASFPGEASMHTLDGSRSLCRLERAQDGVSRHPSHE